MLADCDSDEPLHGQFVTRMGVRVCSLVHEFGHSCMLLEAGTRQLCPYELPSKFGQAASHLPAAVAAKVQEEKRQSRFGPRPHSCKLKSPGALPPQYLLLSKPLPVYTPS